MRRNVRQKDVAFLAFLSSFFAPSVYESHLIIGEFSMEKYESPDWALLVRSVRSIPKMIERLPTVPAPDAIEAMRKDHGKPQSERSRAQYPAKDRQHRYPRSPLGRLAQTYDPPRCRRQFEDDVSRPHKRIQHVGLSTATKSCCRTHQ
ncbi:hypothetical protein [Limimaricola sp. AA108-03]|uniref:hypothetical protein n=1 Tax=Limimaricola sp. AA108-03 TaxID=3425945 RepID=UPI003D777856